MLKKSKQFLPTGLWRFLTVTASVLYMALSIGALAQTAEPAQPSVGVAAVIPQQVRYAGALVGHAGETVEVIFKIYSGAEGGQALWTETQRVAVGRDGTYSVLLGAASEGGLPQGVFAAGQARWLGVTVDRAEGVRAPLASVAYAMKAGDAETVGGLAAASIATKDDLAKLAATGVTAVEAPQIQSATTPTGSGTADYVPLWTASSTLGNSGIYQAASGFIGIGTTTPGGPLQLSTAASGGANATMMLTQTSTASGNYYADIGLYNSKGLIGNLSALGSGYPAGNLFVANDVVFLGGQQNAGTNLIFLTNTSGALKFGTGGFAVSNERMRIGAAGGVSVGNSYVGTDPGAGNLIVSGKVGVGTTAPAANLEVNGTAKFDGLVSFGAGQTFPGTGTLTGVTATSPLTGGGTSGTVTVGLNTATLETTLNSVYARLGAADTFAGATTFTGGITSTATSGTAGSFANTAIGIAALSATNSANWDLGPTYPSAVNGTSTGQDSVGVTGLGTLAGVFGLNNSTAAYGMYGKETARDGDGVFGAALGDGGYGVYGLGGGAADAANTASAGVYGLANSGTGVEGFSVGQSNEFNSLESNYSPPVTAGVWGDTSAVGGLEVGGIAGTADDNSAGWFLNDSDDYGTIYAYNQSSGGTGLFKVFKGATPAGTCGIGDGDLSCTGELKSFATTGGGARTVETYATQSAENWMEDYGTGAMAGGVGVVQIDPVFAETVTADANYHVFLTPRGDSKGLYVTNATATSFEVRESSGGTSSISFDYKIVAKRRGHEAKRLVDVTERFNAEMALTKHSTWKLNTARPAKSGVSRPGVRGADGRSGGLVLPSVTASPRKIDPSTKSSVSSVVQK